MDWSVLQDMLICVPATFFFAVLYRVPKKATVVGAVLGGIGYAVYEWSSRLLGSPIAGYFTGTLLVAACCELLARIFKMPVTVFAIPAIIPMVPGIGLYETMMYLVRGQDSLAGRTGAGTLLDIASMAIAMAVTSIFTRALTRALARKKQLNTPKKPRS